MTSLTWVVINLVVAPIMAALIVVALLRARRDWNAAYALLGQGDPASRALALPLRAARVRGGWVGAASALAAAIVIFLVTSTVTVIVFLSTKQGASWENGNDPFTVLFIEAIVGALAYPVASGLGIVALVLSGANVGSHVAGRRLLARYGAVGDPAAAAASARISSGAVRGVVAALVVAGVVVAVGLGAITAAVAWVAAGFIFIPAAAGSKTM